jgi:hypothetical protein
MLKKAATWFVLTGLFVIGLPAVASASAAPAGNTVARWTVQKSPNPSGNGGFDGVDCRIGKACVAVGSFYDHAGKAQLPLAAAWNGRAWSQQPVPAPAQTSYSDLTGVACPDRTFCSAVGSDVLTSKHRITLAETWRGGRWRIARTPALKAPQYNALTSVSCVSAADCMAVGYADQQALIERWRAGRWTILRTPRPAGSKASMLYGVSCRTRTWCMAVGYYGPPPGGTFAFTEVWNGKFWSIRPAHQVGDYASQFAGVSCTSRVSCTAVGTYGDLETMNYPLAERWNGRAWTTRPVPHPKGQPDSALTAVACGTARTCTATGVYFTSTGPIYTFADYWNGRAWALQSTVNPSRTNNSLSGIACTAALACTAVGGYAGPESVALSLIERYSARRSYDLAAR